MPVLETDRLRLRRLTLGDATFLVQVFNDPAFIQFVGDRHIRTADEAREFLDRVPFESYRQLGFGHYLVERKDDDLPIGICGFIKRETLEDVDIGFSLLPAYRGQGYAFEAASAVMEEGRTALGFTRILAIVSPANERSIQLLERLGLRYERMVTMLPQSPPLKLFAWTQAAPDEGEN